jgi:hypothetical protein
MPGILQKSPAFVPRYYKFESVSLQRRVTRTHHSGRSLDLTEFKSSLWDVRQRATGGQLVKRAPARYRLDQRKLGALSRPALCCHCRPNPAYVRYAPASAGMIV